MDGHEPILMPDPQPETQYWLPVMTEADTRELAAGRVPDWLQESCRRCIEFAIETGPVDYSSRRMAQQRRARRTSKA